FGVPAMNRVELMQRRVAGALSDEHERVNCECALLAHRLCDSHSPSRTGATRTRSLICAKRSFAGMRSQAELGNEVVCPSTAAVDADWCLSSFAHSAYLRRYRR